MYVNVRCTLVWENSSRILKDAFGWCKVKCSSWLKAFCNSFFRMSSSSSSNHTSSLCLFPLTLEELVHQFTENRKIISCFFSLLLLLEHKRMSDDDIVYFSRKGGCFTFFFLALHSLLCCHNKEVIFPISFLSSSHCKRKFKNCNWKM